MFFWLSPSTVSIIMKSEACAWSLCMKSVFSLYNYKVRQCVRSLSFVLTEVHLQFEVRSLCMKSTLWSPFYIVCIIFQVQNVCIKSVIMKSVLYSLYIFQVRNVCYKVRHYEVRSFCMKSIHSVYISIPKFVYEVHSSCMKSVCNLYIMKSVNC